MSVNPIHPLSVTPLGLFAMYDLRLQGSNPESDAWCDDGEAHAVFLLDRFSDADWDALFAALDSRDSHWQHACAAMLFQAADVKRAIDVLTLLGKSADPEVACCARESLGYLAQRAAQGRTGLTLQASCPVAGLNIIRPGSPRTELRTNPSVRILRPRWSYEKPAAAR